MKNEKTLIDPTGGTFAMMSVLDDFQCGETIENENRVLDQPCHQANLEELKLNTLLLNLIERPGIHTFLLHQWPLSDFNAHKSRFVL